MTRPPEGRRRIMSRASLLPAFLVIAAVARVPPADAKTVKPTKMTCEEFLALGDSVKPAAVACLAGYSKGGEREAENIGEVDVDREVAVLVVCGKQKRRKAL